MLGSFIASELNSPSSVMGCLVLAPLWNRRNAALNNATLDALKLTPSDRVLDVGFGGGYLLGKILGGMARSRAVGIDHSPAIVRYVRWRYRAHIRAGALRLQRGAAEYLPFEDRSFTKVCSVNSIFYWDDVPCVLSEVRRVLQPGASFILCFTGHKALENKSFSGEITRYDID